MQIRIKRNSNRAEITVPNDNHQHLSDEVALQLAAFLLAPVFRRLSVEVIELVFEPDDSNPER